MEKNSELNKTLLGLKGSLPAMILEDHFKLRPDMAQRYTEHQKQNFQNDIRWILSFLAEAVWAGQPVLFDEFTSWLKTFLASVNVPIRDVAESFDLLESRIIENCGLEDKQVINGMFSGAANILLSDDTRVSIPAMENHLSPLAQKYLNYLLEGNRSEALTIILEQAGEGVPVKDIYVNVFQPVQYEIGRLWQTNQISVAQEHYCTAATQLVMSQLYPYLFKGQKSTRKMVTTCVPGELHEMGPRMLTDFFEMEGWDTYYLGANMPIDGLIQFLSETRPQFLSISATMAFHVSAVDEMIRRIRSSPSVSGDLKILVGGYPFKVADNLWKDIGADGCASSATEAITLADRISSN